METKTAVHWEQHKLSLELIEKGLALGLDINRPQWERFKLNLAALAKGGALNKKTTCSQILQYG